jgi:hypothetical protein
MIMIPLFSAANGPGDNRSNEWPFSSVLNSNNRDNRVCSLGPDLVNHELAVRCVITVLKKY